MERILTRREAMAESEMEKVESGWFH